MLQGAKIRIRTLAQRKRARVEPFLKIAGLLSKKSERRIRHALRFPPPPIVVVASSPTGAPLVSPIRMKGYDGREQIAHALYFNGWTNYEYPLPSLMTASLTNDPSGVFVDIGANAGVYSLLAKALRPSRGVHAFEPFPPIVDVLTGNVALNPFASGIVVVAMAASDQAGIARLFIPTAEHGLIETSASLSSDFKDQHSEVVEVRTIRLDDYYGSFSERIGIMKVDVEGAEGRLLRGATKVLARDRPIIFCEILPTSRTWDQVRKILSDCDYAIAEIQEDAVNMSVVEVQDVNVDNYILYPRGKTESVRKLASIAHVRCAG